MGVSQSRVDGRLPRGHSNRVSAEAPTANFETYHTPRSSLGKAATVDDAYTERVKTLLDAYSEPPVRLLRFYRSIELDG